MRKICRRTAAGAIACAAATGGVTLATAVAQSGQPDMATGGDVIFDFVPVGTTSPPERATITNRGTAPGTVEGVRIHGQHRSDFRITADGCTGVSLRPGEACAISVVFQPTAEGTRVAHMRVVDSVACNNNMTLAGSGTTTSSPKPARAAACGSRVSTTSGPTSTVTTPGGTTTVTSATSLRTVERRRCVSRRRFRIRVRPPKGVRITSVTARIKGKPAPVHRRRDRKGVFYRVLVDLRGRKSDRYRVVTRMRTSTGRTATVTRFFNTCVANRSTRGGRPQAGRG